MPVHLKNIIRTLGALLGVLLIGLGFLMNQPAARTAGSADLTVTYFDVGQGDSILIETPDFQNILIDGGPDETVLEKLGDRLESGEKIDLMVLTHPHADHVSGLISVFERYDVERVLATGVVHTTRTYEEWLRLMKEEEASFTVAKWGEVFDLGDDIEIEVLYPFDDLSGKTISELPVKLDDGLNDTSVVLLLSYKDTSFLFTGDASKSVEGEVLASFGEDLDSDVLKVGHHGSDTSSSWDFLQAVSPKYAVISVGEGNSYGHPSEAALERLTGIGALVFRTDEQGDIEIASDGEKVWEISNE